MSDAIEVRFEIHRTVRIEDRDAVALYWDDPDRLDDLIADLAERQQIADNDVLVRWTVEPHVTLPPLCGTTRSAPAGKAAEAQTSPR